MPLELSLWSDRLTNHQRPINKWTRYLPIYERHFHHYVDKSLTFIEMGGGRDGSLQTWKRYFGPFARIIGLDADPDSARVEEDRIHIRIGSPEDVGFLRSIIKEFGAPDVVLDNGNHKRRQIRAAFHYLYLQTMSSGIYMIGDFRTTDCNEHDGPTQPGIFIGFAKNLIDELNAAHARKGLAATAFAQNTSAMHFYDGVIVFERGRPGELPAMVGRPGEIGMSPPASDVGDRRRWAVSPKQPAIVAVETGDRRRWAPAPGKRDPAAASIGRRVWARSGSRPTIAALHQTEDLDLEGWPTVSVESLDIRHLGLEELREVMIQGRRDAAAYVVETAPGGSALARVLDCDQYSEPREIARAYLGDPRPPFTWRAEHLILLNEPCYLVVGTGVVLLGDGRIVRETVFSSEEPFAASGNQTISFRIGGGLSSVGQLPFLLRAAPTLDDHIWAPLLSRWSMVYGHMISESLVQDSALHRAGFSPLIRFAATADPEGAQPIAMTEAHASVASFMHPIVKVPRLIFASKLYRHFPLGAELRNAVGDVKTRISSQAGLREPVHEKIYVSRLGIANRQMTNEADLIARLSDMGFHIAAPQSMSFEEQVLTFRGARLIVGPYGSGLANSVFAAPDAALCELRPLHTALDSPLWDTYYYCLASTMGFSYGAHISTNPPKTDSWLSDIPQVLEFIRSASAAVA